MTDIGVVAGERERLVDVVRDLDALDAASRGRGSGRCAGGPGSTPGRLSKVLRPMIIALPMVSALKCLRSPGMCHGSLPSVPITPLMARATTMVMGGPVHALHALAGSAHAKPSALLHAAMTDAALAD